MQRQISPWLAKLDLQESNRPCNHRINAAIQFIITVFNNKTTLTAHGIHNETIIIYQNIPNNFINFGKVKFYWKLFTQYFYYSLIVALMVWQKPTACLGKSSYLNLPLSDLVNHWSIHVWLDIKIVLDPTNSLFHYLPLNENWHSVMSSLNSCFCPWEVWLLLECMNECCWISTFLSQLQAISTNCIVMRKAN